MITLFGEIRDHENRRHVRQSFNEAMFEYVPFLSFLKSVIEPLGSDISIYFIRCNTEFCDSGIRHNNIRGVPEALLYRMRHLLYKEGLYG